MNNSMHNQISKLSFHSGVTLKSAAARLERIQKSALLRGRGGDVASVELVAIEVQISEALALAVETAEADICVFEAQVAAIASNYDVYYDDFGTLQTF